MDIICGTRFLARLTIITFIVGLAVGLYLAFEAGYAIDECVAATRLAEVFHV